jgi:hypothetical protein
MLVEKIYAYYERLSLEKSLDNVIHRASLANKCIRYLGFKKLGVIGKLNPRAYMMFKLGDMIELIIKDDIMLALKQSPDIEVLTENEEVSIDLGEGIVLSGHIDGFIYAKDRNEYGVLEIKSASNFAFDEALEGKVDEDYIVQASLYAMALKVDFVCFIFYRKETSHYLEVSYSRNIGNDAVVRYMQHPERSYFVVQYPFDLSYVPKIREKYKILSKVMSIEDVFSIPIPYDMERCVNCDGTGFKEYGKCRVCKGTGKKVELDGFIKLSYPCSYCPYNILCYPNQQVEFDGLKPVIKVRKT